MDRLSARISKASWASSTRPRRDRAGPFPAHVVDQLRALLGCEWGSYCELDRRDQRALALVEAPVPDDGMAEETFWRLVDRAPAVPGAAARPFRRAEALGLPQPSFSCIAASSTPIGFAPAGVEFELELALPSPLEHTKTFLFDDARHDFGERERALLNLLQPHLVQLYRNAALRRRRRRSARGRRAHAARRRSARRERPVTACSRHDRPRGTHIRPYTARQPILDPLTTGLPAAPADATAKSRCRERCQPHRTALNGPRSLEQTVDSISCPRTPCSSFAPVSVHTP